MLLGGYNGMTGIPALQVGNFVFEGYSFYYLTLVIVILCYLGLRMFVNSHSGRSGNRDAGGRSAHGTFRL